MNLALASNFITPSTNQSASEIGIELYSSNIQIEGVINDSIDDRFRFLLIYEGDFTFISCCTKNEYGRGLLVIPPKSEGDSVILHKNFIGFLFCIPESFVTERCPLSVYNSLDSRSVNMLRNYYDLMQDALSMMESPYSGTELICLCRAFTVSCRQHYRSFMANNCSRHSDISNDFLKLVKSHSPRERELRYYADILSISPKYLSSVVASTTSKRASQWISESSIDHAKHLLLNTRMSVQEIAKEMRFSSCSEFCRYFHKRTGYAPSKYRQYNVQSVMPSPQVDC